MIRVKLDESNHQQILVDCHKIGSTACYIKTAEWFRYLNVKLPGSVSGARTY